MVSYNPNRDKHSRFNSPEELLEFCNKLPGTDLYWGNEGNKGGLPWPLALKALENGDTTAVYAAEKIMQEMADQQVFTSGLKLLTSDVVGFMPIVPAVIAGLPECMLNRSISEIEATNTPISIYVQTTVSAGLSHKEIENRGIAILALAMAFANIRPIELYTVSLSDFYGDGEATGSITRIETRPLDLARAAFMLCNVTMARMIGHEVSKAHSRRKNNRTGIPHAWGINPMSEQSYELGRELIGCSPQDIYISGGYLLDKLMLNNPIQWVKNMIAKHSHSQEV